MSDELFNILSENAEHERERRLLAASDDALCEFLAEDWQNPKLRPKVDAELRRRESQKAADSYKLAQDSHKTNRAALHLTWWVLALAVLTLLAALGAWLKPIR